MECVGLVCPPLGLNGGVNPVVKEPDDGAVTLWNVNDFLHKVLINHENLLCMCILYNVKSTDFLSGCEVAMELELSLLVDL